MNAIPHLDMYRWVFHNPARFGLTDDGADLTARPELDAALEAIRRGGLKLELNPHFAHQTGRIDDTYPAAPIFRRAREMGIPFVYGSDAHTADHVGGLLGELDRHPLFGPAIREMDDYHESGRFEAIAAKAFPDAGDLHAAVIESGFDAQINALLRCPCPAMLGHFLIAHTKPARAFIWFGESERHLALMKAKTAELLAVCRRTGSMIDLTGLHLYHCTTMTDQRLHDGFLYDYQRSLLEDCRAMGIPCAPGSDAHGLGGIKDSRLFEGYWE